MKPLDPDRDRWFLGTLMHFHVRGADSGGRMSVTEQVARRGFSPPVHVHAREEGMMYVLEGELSVVVGDERRTVRAGEAIFLPRDVPHSFFVESERVRLLEVSTPGGADEFYRSCGTPAGAADLPPPAPPSPETLALVDVNARSHGTTLLGPPLAR